MRSPWKKRFAVPSEHGTWAWWLGPFVIGVAAGGHLSWTLLPLFVAAAGGFFAHQPAQIAVKALTGRRPRTDLVPALVWLAVYAIPIALGAACLAATGYAKVLALAGPGLVVFAWHLLLIARKAERRQMAIEMLAAAVLALAAPAAYWVAGGTDYPDPWLLWLMTWLQSAASIANVYLRLEQRRWPRRPDAKTRLRAGTRTLVHHVVALVVAAAIVAGGRAPAGVLAAFAIPLLDTIDATWRPAMGKRPVQIGLRQLAVTTAFVTAMVLAYTL